MYVENIFIEIKDKSRRINSWTELLIRRVLCAYITTTDEIHKYANLHAIVKFYTDTTASIYRCQYFECQRYVNDRGTRDLNRTCAIFAKFNAENNSRLIRNSVSATISRSFYHEKRYHSRFFKMQNSRQLAP